MIEYKKLGQLFSSFFIIGSVTFGGGLAMFPLMEKEVTEKRKWLEEEEMLDIFAIAQSTPGVIAVNVSIFVGSKVAGPLGIAAAVLGVVLPAFISILLIMIFLSGFRGNRHVNNLFSGIKAASAALILLAAIKACKSAIRNKLGIVIAVIAFLMIVVLNLNAAWVVLFGGVAGYFSYYINRRKSKC